VQVSKGQPDRREALFDGRGVVQVWNLLAEFTAMPAPFTAVLSCELDPGGSVGAHVQDQFPELVVGLEGDGEATVDGEPRALGPGDVVHLPLGSVLTLRNRSDTAALRYLIIKARA
jgi:quercetin dioxygenase-like cupin family protein